MATTTYGISTISAAHRLNNSPNDVTGSQASIAIASTTDGHWVAQWDTQSSADLQGLYRDMSDTTGALFDANTTVTGNQNDAEIAGLADGRAVVVFSDNSGGAGNEVIRARFVNPTTGATSASDVVVSGIGVGNADVIGLADGGFVVTYEGASTPSDHNIWYAIYNADGSFRNSNFSTLSSHDEIKPHVVGLIDGSFVMTWVDKVPDDGVFAAYDAIRWKHYDSTGAEIGSGDVTSFANVGSLGDPSMASTYDGGWAIVYRAPRTDGYDITLKIFDASGTLTANKVANVGATAGDQFDPTVAVLTNGMIVVGWNSPGFAVNLPQNKFSIFDGSGNLVTGPTSLLGSGNFNLDIAALAQSHGHFVAAGDNLGIIGDSNVDAGVLALTRTITGDSTSETLNGGDDLDDVINGNGGNDSMFGGAGLNTLNGGAGWDKANYGVSAAAATIVHHSDGTSTISIPGASVVDTLQNVEVARFLDQDVILASSTFGSASLALNNFGQNQGWTNNNLFHRDLGDLNGDQKADIIGFGQAGVLTALSNGNGTFATVNFALNNFGQAQGWSSDDATHRVVGDVNGDGRADIVGFGQAGTWVALGQGDGTFAAAALKLANFGQAQGWASDATFHRALADVNGDGQADIVGFGQNNIWVSLATGGGNFAAATAELANFVPATGWSSDNTYHREVADVNGDGIGDIVGFGAAGTLVALGTGGGHFAAPTTPLTNFGTAQGWSSQTATPRHLADVNGDGMADIIGFGQNNVFVAFATGNGQFTQAITSIHDYTAGAGGWTSDSTLPRLVADVSGDGHADIVGFGVAGALNSYLLL